MHQKLHTKEAKESISRSLFDRWAKAGCKNSPEHRMRNTLKMRNWRLKNAERNRENQRLRAKANPQRVRDANLKHRLGITLREWSRIFNTQNGCCAVCYKAGVQLVTDHCHTTGRVRGLVCIRCNMYLGVYEWILAEEAWLTSAKRHLGV